MSLNGKVAESKVDEFTFVTRTVQENAPAFGTLVKVRLRPGVDSPIAIGAIYDINIRADSYLRTLALADNGAIKEAELRAYRESTLEIVGSAVCLGIKLDDQTFTYEKPSRPPSLLEEVISCSEDEVRRFTADPQFIRRLLNWLAAPVVQDDLIFAIVREARALQPDPEAFVQNCALELAQRLQDDFLRLDALLRRFSNYLYWSKKSL